MKNDIPRLVPIWFWPSTLLILILSLGQCGCKTGGKKLNPNSAGTIIRTSDIRPNFKPLPPVPIAPPKSTPAKITNPVKSKPVIPKHQSAKANSVTSNPESAGELAPFTPTISESIDPIILPKMDVKVAPTESNLIENNNVNVQPQPMDNKGTALEIKTTEKQENFNWLNLLSFYLICLLGLVILWVIYDIIKDSIQMKKQGTPIKDHLKNLKKPAKGTRSARKAATKKKTTKGKKR